jgi:hypothetical protein
LPKTKIPSLCYVYCVVEGSPPALPATGMPDGSAPRALPLADQVVIVVSDVDDAIYAAEALEPKLSDLDWVSRAGAAHHAVIDAIAASGATVLPFRLFTLFSTTDKALVTLRESGAAMARAFDRVRGKEEWVLRIGKPEASRAEPTQPAPAASTRTTGTNFLQARAEAKRQAAARATRVREDAAAAYEALEQLADAAKTRQVDAGGSLILDAAFLVPPARLDAMRETLTRRAERLLRDGCAVSLTGPWPPYSFASMDAVSYG